MTTDTRLILPVRERTPLAEEGSVQFIGNATVLIRYAGMTILTDPTFIHRHEQVSIGYGMHSTRLVDPAMEIQDLPPLDLILLSHFHGDHFDQVAERDLDKCSSEGFGMQNRSPRGRPSPWKRVNCVCASPRCRGAMGRRCLIW
jgi:hypothetical protein